MYKKRKVEHFEYRVSILVNTLESLYFERIYGHSIETVTSDTIERLRQRHDREPEVQCAYFCPANSEEEIDITMKIRGLTIDWHKEWKPDRKLLDPNCKLCQV